ncbi:hypothetical protein ACIRUY_27950 [Streptomyces erythrochromogenes]|uniref:hypothetical protein n=1 Tax=Streptomyces erythrochromogenes TaxID=285574 RepID=UPI003446E60A
MDEGQRLDTRLSGEPPADRYLLQFWPEPPRADRVLRQTSRKAAYWHRYARELPAPPTAEQRAESERLDRQAQQRAAEEERLHRERWEWGGRLPSGRLRGVGGCVNGLLAFDSDLVHALDTRGAEVQRAVASLAARRACEAAGLMGVPWVTEALTALTEARPLPPPFDVPGRMWDALRSDPRVPSRSVVEAVPPERPPYRPLTPSPAVGRTSLPAAEPGDDGRRRSVLGRGLGALLPPAPAGDGPTPTEGVGRGAATVHTYGTPRTPRTPATPRPSHGLLRISQPHFALPAVLAAAAADPLEAALEAVFQAVSTCGEHYPKLLEEIRSVCADRAEE